jgi:hypothetical protein
VPAARPHLESLEGRAAPSALRFYPNALVVGTAALDTGTAIAAQSAYLARGSVYGTLARAGPPPGSVSMAHSEASVNYSYYNAHQLSLEEDTSAYAGAIYRSAKAQVNLNPGVWNGGPGFVNLSIAPSYRGETSHWVLVTLRATYRNTNVTQTTGHNFVQVSYNTGSGQRNLLIGSDYREPPGGQTISSSASFYARAGSTFSVCQTLLSYAGTNNSAGASLTLSVTTRDV